MRFQIDVKYLIFYTETVPDVLKKTNTLTMVKGNL